MDESELTNLLTDLATGMLLGATELQIDGAHAAAMVFQEEEDFPRFDPATVADALRSAADRISGAPLG